MTYAVMLGVDAGEPPAEYEDGWDTLIERYKRHHADGPRLSTPSGDTDMPNLLGFWVAGADGYPELASFELDDFARSPKYQATFAAALAAWRNFRRWGKAKGLTGRWPRLYLVRTEVA